MDYEVDSEDEWEEEPEDGEQLSVRFPASKCCVPSVACCSQQHNMHDWLNHLSTARVGCIVLCVESEF